MPLLSVNFTASCLVNFVMLRKLIVIVGDFNIVVIKLALFQSMLEVKLRLQGSGINEQSFVDKKFTKDNWYWVRMYSKYRLLDPFLSNVRDSSVVSVHHL